MEKEISKRLIDLRKGKKLTQKQLADKLGVSKNTVSSWERGDSEPSCTCTGVLASAFGVSTDWIILGVAPDETIANVTEKPPVTHYNAEGMFTRVKTTAEVAECYEAVKTMTGIKKYLKQNHSEEEVYSKMNCALETACLLQALGFNDDDILSTALLKDMCKKSLDDVSFVEISDEVKSALSLLLKESNYREENEKEMYTAIAGNRVAVIVRLVDYISRFYETTTSLNGSKNRAAHVARVEQYLMPMLELAIEKYPQYHNELFLIKYFTRTNTEMIRFGLALKGKKK